MDREVEFESAADIRVFLAERLPYYESEDKDDFLYIVRDSDIQKLSVELFNMWQESASKAQYK